MTSGDVRPRVATSGDVRWLPATFGDVRRRPAMSSHVRPLPATSSKHQSTSGKRPATSGEVWRRPARSGDVQWRPATSGDVRRRPATFGDVRLRPAASGGVRRRLAAPGKVWWLPTILLTEKVILRTASASWWRLKTKARKLSTSPTHCYIFQFWIAIGIKVGLSFSYRISSGMKESPWHMVDVLRRRPKIYVPWQKSN